jgi:hypothetical protein
MREIESVVYLFHVIMLEFVLDLLLFLEVDRTQDIVVGYWVLKGRNYDKMNCILMKDTEGLIVENQCCFKTSVTSDLSLFVEMIGISMP